MAAWTRQVGAARLDHRRNREHERTERHKRRHLGEGYDGVANGTDKGKLQTPGLSLAGDAAGRGRQKRNRKKCGDPA